MIGKVNSSGPYAPSIQGQNQNIDIHNASLNDVKSVVGQMMKNGKISIKDMLPFLAIDTQPLSDAVGKELHVQYYGDLWEHPNKKQDMMQTMKDILAKQQADGAQNAQSTQRAIALLEKIDQGGGSSFADILKQKSSGDGL